MIHEGVRDDARPPLLSKFDRAVRRTGVHDNGGVGDIRNALQTPFNVTGLIEREDDY